MSRKDEIDCIYNVCHKKSKRGEKMKKELVICIIIIVFIVVGNIVTQNYTKECVYQINAKLDNLKEASLDAKNGKENKKLIEKIDEIENTWNEYQEKLAYYIEHDELEKVENQIYTIKGFGQIQKYDEIVPELEKCIFTLKHIQEKTKINIKNIF